jgi:hypothetical protein
MTDWIYLGGDFGEPISSPDSKEGVVSLAMLFGVIVLRYWHEGEIKALQIDTRSHIQQIETISEDVQDKKSWTAAIAIAGVMVAGPLGALAGLATPKKKTVIFSMALKEGESGRVTRESFGVREGKKIVLATSKDNYSKILANCGLHPQVMTAAVASLSEGTDIVQQLEKLAALKESGLISEEEFAIAKAKLL